MCSGVVLVANELKRRTAMEEKNESRINIEDLPVSEQELTADESKEVKGGSGATLQLQNGLTVHDSINTYRGTTTVADGIF
jgi:hypothetical protein